jgi:hypothetical protein
MDMSLNAEYCNPTEIANNTCHFASHSDEIVASSNKLMWLPEFVSELVTNRDWDTGHAHPENSSCLQHFQLLLMSFDRFTILKFDLFV